MAGNARALRRGTQLGVQREVAATPNKPTPGAGRAERAPTKAQALADWAARGGHVRNRLQDHAGGNR